MTRRLFTVVDATNVTRATREPLVTAVERHNIPAIAVMVTTPASVCVERQSPRPANRTVPDDTVHRQHKAMVHSHRSCCPRVSTRSSSPTRSTGCCRNSSG
ncbi:AAA family ATPase [Streptomyces sp. NPDC054841]